MHLSMNKKYVHRLISLVIAIVMLVVLVAPAKTANAAAAPTFQKKSIKILEGDSDRLGINNYISSASYVWKSSNKSIVSVNEEGTITAHKKGDATINCKITSGKKTYSLRCSVSVKKPASEILISNKIDYLLVGETYDLNRILKPKSSNDITTWSSDNPKVMSPDKMGVFTALKEGVATITATTMSGVTDNVTIYVVKEKSKTITGTDVVDGKVKLKDKSYGELIITNSVGNAQIDLTNITVGGSLVMESGADYTVSTKKSNINKVSAVDHLGISSLAETDDQNNAESKSVPSFIAGSGSLVVSIDSECNINVKQTGSGTIQSFSLITKQDGSIEINLEGFQGNLIIDSQSSAAISIVTSNCDMSSATVKNSTEGQSISLTDTNAGTDKASVIRTVNMESSAALTLGIKTEEVIVTKDANHAEVTIEQPAMKLTNEGNNTSLTIRSQVEEITSSGKEALVTIGGNASIQNLTVSGKGTNVGLQNGASVSTVTTVASNTRVTISEGARIQTVIANGSNNKVDGSGKVESAIVTGNNSCINTEGTNVEVAKGTVGVSVGGVPVKADEDNVIVTAPTATPTPKPTDVPAIPVVPTVVPTIAPTVTPTPTPDLTDQEKLNAYQVVLGDLYTEAIKYLDDSNSANFISVKAQYNKLYNLLKEFKDIEPELSLVQVLDQYMDDYTEFLIILVDEGVDYGLRIRLYYENIESNTQTLEGAIGAANNIIHMISRVNEEEELISRNVAAIFSVLEDTPEQFYSALTQLKEEAELVGVFPQEYAPIIQNKFIKQLLEDEYIRACYETGRKLTYIEGLTCIIAMQNLYYEEYTKYSDFSTYHQLVDQLIDLMPPLKVHLWFDEKTQTTHYQYVEYDTVMNKAEIINALQALFNEVELKDFFGEDLSTFTVNPLEADAFVQNLAYQLSYFETYEDGSVEILNYYVKNKDTMNFAEEVETIYQCVGAILYGTYGTQLWSEEYIATYQVYVDDLIDAINADDEEALYQGLVALYEKKLSDPNSSEVWQWYDKPVDETGKLIDVSYCMRLLKHKSEALSEEYNNEPVNSSLYDYFINRNATTASLLSEAIYDFVLCVEESQIWFVDHYNLIKPMVNGLMEALINLDGEAAYRCISDINQYFDNKHLLLPLDDKGYVPIAYMEVLRDAMLYGDDNQALREYYFIYCSMEEGDYSRYISTIANNVIWSVGWFTSEEALPLVQDKLVSYSELEHYETLLQAVVDTMPEITVYTWTDEEGNVRYDYSDYDRSADLSHVISKIEALFEGIYLPHFLGDEYSDFRPNLELIDGILVDLARQISRYGEDENGPYENLHYFLNHRDRDTMNLATRMQSLRNAIGSVLWGIVNHHDWNEWYLMEYREMVGRIIDAAEANDEEALYEALVALYEKKLSENGSPEEWNQYDKPFDENGKVIDLSYCMQLIKRKLEPLSEYRDDQPVNSRLYQYTSNREKPTALLLDEAIYDLVDCVWESQIWFVDHYNLIKPMVNGLMEALINQDGEASYKYICDISQYFNHEYEPIPLDEKGYVPMAYMEVLRDTMLYGDDSQALKEYYYIYSSMGEGDYSRYISTIANNVLWSVRWYISEEGLPVVQDRLASYFFNNRDTMDLTSIM